MATLNIFKTFDGNGVIQSNSVVGTRTVAGSLYAVNTNLHLIQVKDTGGSAVNLRPESDTVGGAVEYIVKEINPLAYFTQNTASGNIYVITDKNISAGDLQHRVRQLGANTAATSSDGNRTFTYSATWLGINHVDVSGTTVTAGTSFQVL